ncbi:MAG: MBL fold metallo-hydrolase [Gemmataceae bacterium]|nr:MBL fold metallo-hydrolase [Gemmataceae bacterium]
MKFREISKDVFLFEDTCNVYVVRDGDAGLLIDLGAGAVLDHLHEIGVKKIEWALFTHHHREQCQGHPRLIGTGAKTAAPEAERALFENPTSFRKIAPTLGDAFTVHGASFVRPPIIPLKLDLTFQKMDDFNWRGREFWCLDTSGNSPGGMSYLLKTSEGWLAFSGDAMLAGGKLHTWFDSEWDYGFSKGIYALHNAAGQLEGFNPAWLLPSHGEPVRSPRAQLIRFRETLREMNQHYLRGWEVMTFASADQDRVSQPTVVPHIWQVSKHLFKFRGPDYWPNFHMLLADSGKAMVVDCGLFKKEFLDKALRLMQERLGLKSIEVVVVTHMHGDHCLEAPHLREKYGAKLWTLDRVVPLVQRPLHFDYCAQINTYGKGIDSISFDRILRDGETFHWEGFTLTADWMPGQTEFALCLHGDIDGKKVAFTGDNAFGASADPKQTGHEAVVARNSCILEESYIYAAKYLQKLKPDLLLGGHCWAIPEPKALIDRGLASALKLKDHFTRLSIEPDYRWMYDPYWVRLEPYRVVLKGQSAEARLYLRNFAVKPMEIQIQIALAKGFRAEPAVIATRVAGEATISVPVRFINEGAAKGLHLAGFDITREGKRHGQLFDGVLFVQ